ncbi:MAG: SAM-dependent methyltransferase [Flavobacteriales bacterium]|nr:SAM-dependent methyltransferase [Flavobacteriales bacterium]
MDLSKNRKIIKTNDGSHTLVVPELNEHYHSIHGAVNEANHVFLKMGLDEFMKQKASLVNVFEVGFGTGLNALLSAKWAKINSCNLHYTSIEKYPVSKEEFDQLNYGISVNEIEIYEKIYSTPWNELNKVSKSFYLKKLNLDILKDVLPGGFDVVFFDAFAPNKQPELWTVSVFKKMYEIMNKNSLLVTYCCQGQAKRNMIEAGFSVEKVPGPPGKREMLRARKL